MDFGFVLFVLFAVIIVYNGAQVVKAINGIRYEKPSILFFFACFIDLFLWIKKKL